MTNDNDMEMSEVLRLCREVPMHDIVTLGGAIGCRDPKLIIEDILKQGRRNLSRVFFNDLCPAMVCKARESVLAPLLGNGLECTFRAGEIREVCKDIEPLPRRLLVGVYEDRSFFIADPANGYNLSGFDEYLANRRTLGDHFLMDWVSFDERFRHVSSRVRASVSYDNDSAALKRTKLVFGAVQRETWVGSITDLSALQVIGRSPGRSGFFLSHWFTPQGMNRLMSAAFPSGQFVVQSTRFPKGRLFWVTPKDVKPLGVVTMLNNVLGNIIPQDQFASLLAIRRIISLGAV